MKKFSLLSLVFACLLMGAGGTIATLIVNDHWARFHAQQSETMSRELRAEYEEASRAREEELERLAKELSRFEPLVRRNFPPDPKNEFRGLNTGLKYTDLQWLKDYKNRETDIYRKTSDNPNHVLYGKEPEATP